MKGSCRYTNVIQTLNYRFSITEASELQSAVVTCSYNIMAAFWPSLTLINIFTSDNIFVLFTGIARIFSSNLPILSVLCLVEVYLYFCKCNTCGVIYMVV